jgi:inosine/xanthosine triphosphate pyrophosphatase family protein
MYQPNQPKTLRQIEHHGIGSYHIHLGFCKQTGSSQVFNGNCQFNELQSFFQPGFQNNIQMMAVTIITECSKNDPAIEMIGRTALIEAKNLFPNQNILIGMAENPYMTRDAANAPLKCAEALFNGYAMFYCSQSNVLGATGKRAIFSLSINLDATNKTYSNDESRHTNSAYPASVMFNVQDDNNGIRLSGRALTERVLKSFSGNNGYTTASSYGIAQKPSTTDTDGEIIPLKPSINFSFHDEVRILSAPNFVQPFTDTYHGLLMAYPFLQHSQFIQSEGKLIFSPNSAIARCLRASLSEIMIPDVFTLTFGILTTNKKKVIEIKNIIGTIFDRLNTQYNNTLSKFKIVVEQIKFSSMVEEQILDPVECIESKVDKCRLTSDQISAVLGKQCIFIDDTSFAVTALDMQPGTFYKQHYEKGEADFKAGKALKYNNFICDMVNAYVSRENKGGLTQNQINELRCAYATTIFACIFSNPWGTVFDCILRSTVTGIISDRPKAKDMTKEFGWDPIFIPLSIEQKGRPGQFEVLSVPLTYQEMDDESLSRSKPRGFAVSKMLTRVICFVTGKVLPAEEYDFGMTKQEQTESTDKMNRALAVSRNMIATGQASVTNVSNTAVNSATMTGTTDLNAIFAAFQ